MSSTGVRDSNSNDKRVIKGLILNEAQFIQSLRVFANTSTISGLGATEGEINNSPIEASGNYLSRLGDTMLGPLALSPPLDFTIEIDANNTIDIGPLNDNAQYTSNVQLDSIQPNSFVLDIIANAAFDGQLLFLRTFAPSTPFTISQGTLGNGGNIQTGDGNDLTVGDLQIVTLIFDAALIIEANTGGSWRVLSVSSGGTGGALSEPIELGFNEVVTQTPPTLTIIAGDQFNPSHIDLDQDIELQLDVSATTSKYKSIFVIFDTTGGGFTVTWPASVVNPPIIPDTVAQRISVILYTINNGTLWTHATSVGSSTGGEFFGPWTANHDAGLKDLTNLGNIDFNGTAATIQGLSNLDFFQASHSINSLAGSMIFQVDTLDFLGFFAGGVPIAKFDDTTGLTIQGTHVINMGNNIINTISELQFSNANAHTPSNELSIAFDTNDDALKYSVPLTTDVHMFFADTDLLATFSRVGTNEGLLSIQAVTATSLQATETLFLSTFNNTTPTNGEIWRDSGDGKFKFRQNGVTDEIGTQSAIVDGNSSATILDAAPSFVVVLDGVQKYSISNTRVDYEELDLFGITQINMNDSGANLISSLSASATGLLLNILDPNDFYDIKFNSADAFHVDDIRTRILSTTPNTTPATLSMFRDDASPTIGDELGIIKYDGKNSIDAFTTYGEASVTIESLTDNAEFANYIINLKQNGFDVDMLRIVDGAMILRTFTPGSGNGANFTLLKEDASPGNDDLIGNVNWNVLDSPTELTYARMQVFIQEATDAALFKIQMRSDGTLQDAFIIEANDNSTQFQYLTSGNGNTRMQPLGSARMGYFVSPQATDFLTNIGTSGTLQIPQINDGGPSLNDLNQAGGAFDGAIVHDINDGSLYIRKTSSAWSHYVEFDEVV